MKRIILVLTLLAVQTTSAATFTVTNTLDSGAGSLRAAITSANATGGGTNLIQFNIPGTNVQTITPASALPPITRPVFIDGYTQPGASPNTNSLANGFSGALQIELNGANIGGVGLLLSGGGGSTIRGLVINRCNYGVLISLSSNNVVEGCFVGVNPAGSSAQVNGIGIFVSDGNASSFNLIGGTNAAARNLISGNGTGVFIQTGTNNVVQGNFIGTDATGTNGLANSIGVSLAASDTLVGGTNVAARNIIAEGFQGIFVGAVTGTRIQGNFIGTDATGSRALGLRVGIALDSTASATQIGGPTAMLGAPPGNVITTTSQEAIQVAGNGNTIQGNLVCTDATGRNPLGNARFGITIYGAFNLISSNVISGSVGEAGLFAGNSVSLVHDNLIQGNFIGPDITGTNLIGNAGNGIWVSLATSNTIQSNVIAGNRDQGVFIASGTTAQAVLGNSIFANAGLGIFLGSGANNSQTNPVITSVTTGGGSVTLAGSLKSGTNAAYRLEFFSNASCDGSGSGEGQVFLGSTNVTTDASGNAGFSLTLTNPASHANFAATATDTNGNTSAFSPCVSVSGPCVINCSNMVVSTAANACGAIVTFFPTTSGNCGAVNCSPASGSSFPKGTNTVTCTSANGTNCSFTIIVLDTIAPSITCPANIVTNAPFSGAVVNYPAPTVMDNCGVASTNCSPASGSFFPLGTTTVTCTATDTSGNTNTCSFTVTVIRIVPNNRFWTNSLGGNYQDTANWLSNQVPGVLDNANFTNNASYTVSWTNNAAAANAIFKAGTVTQSIGAFTWLLTNSYYVGNIGSTVAVTHTSGSLHVTNEARNGYFIVGDGAVGTYQLVGANAHVVVDELLLEGSPGGNKMLISGGASCLVKRDVISSGLSLTTVTDPGSILGYQDLYLGFANRLVISNAATAFSIDAYLGSFGLGKSNNVVILTGAGSLWLITNYIAVGYDGSGNFLSVSDGATLSAARLTVGDSTNSTNNRLVIDGGSLHLTNLSVPHILEVRRGTNELLHAGLIEAEQLLMTSGAGFFEFNGGTLDLRGAAVANGQAFTVGDGSTAATLNVRTNGGFSFANGLTLRSMASLTGNGRIGGTLLAQSGSTIAPGASTGKIVLTNSPTLQGAMLMEISKSGAVLTNDQLQVLAALTYGGTLTVSNIGPDALVLGNHFQLFNATSYAGSFSSISLPVPGQGLSWTNKLLVDGSIEVISNQLPVALCRNVMTNAGATCTANVFGAAVDNGSFDPDGTIVSRTLSPAGPYPKGTNLVTLTVTDDQGSSNSCTATIIVLDTTPPTINCPANVVTNVPHNQTAVVVNYPAPSVSDSCSGALTTTCVPPSGVPFQLGVTTVTCTATDASGNTNNCSFTVTVNPAATLTWSGAGANAFWTNAANWVGNIAPANGDALVFPTNAVRLVNTNTAGGPISLASITLKGSNYVIHSPPLTLFGGLTNLPPSLRSNRLEAVITLGGDQVWRVFDQLTLASNVNLSSFHLTLTPAGTVEALGNITGSAGSQLLLDNPTLVLKGPANDIPDLNVLSGNLVVDGVLSGGLSIGPGGNLEGHGTVPPFTCAGEFIPGGPFSPGAITVSSGTATFTSGSDFQADLFGSTTPGIDYDQLKVSTPPDLSGAALYVTPSYSAAVGETFVIITNTGAAPFTTTFSGLPEGSLYVISSPSNKFRLSYIGGDGNDVVLTRVPTSYPPAIPLSGGTYMQDFNTLATNGTANTWSNGFTLFGWYAAQTNAPSAISTYRAGAGGETTGALYSFGSTGSTERALGSLASGTPGTIGFGVCFINDTAASVSNFTISYTGEQWRSGGPGSVTNTLSFSYRVSTLPLTNPEPGVVVNWTAATNLNFVSPTANATAGTLDGNQATNRHVFSVISIPGLIVPPGQEVFFRWIDPDDFGFDQGMAVDDLTVAFSIPIPRLTIELAPPNAVRLLWPTNAAGFNLEANTNVAGTNWLPVSPPPAVVGTNNVVTNSASGAQKFYRLKK